ncbi:MAG: sialate O-acetylesterase, partial [Chitinophagaceae bacterium]
MKRRIKFLIFTCICIPFYYVTAFAGIKLPALFTDNMVLQQKSDDPVWGWASPGEEISVKGSWNNTAVKAKTNADGKWMLKIKTPKAGGPFTLTIKGSQTIVLHNVMIGEVWVCSGQSNMELPMEGWSGAPVLNSAEEIKAANYPDIRLFTVKRDIAFKPQEDCVGSWSECSPKTVPGFSAAAYFFGRQLYQKLKVPIGLIETCWGGTVAEAWTSNGALRKLGGFDSLLNVVDSVRYHLKETEAKGKSDEEAIKSASLLSQNPNTPTVLYNGMIAPIIPFAMRGVIWYQGESNVGRAAQYAQLFPAMIHDWRNRWHEGEFPFYFIQIAPFPYGGNGMQAAALRDAQRQSLQVPNTGMVVTLDIGDTTNIHPANKEEVGRRLSLWAFNKLYDEKGIVYSGPLYSGMKIEGSKAIISFKYADGGLMAKGGRLTCFEIAGQEGKFVPTVAR